MGHRRLIQGVFHGILISASIILLIAVGIYACSLEIHQTRPVTPNQCGGTGGTTHH